MADTLGAHFPQVRSWMTAWRAMLAENPSDSAQAPHAGYGFRGDGQTVFLATMGLLQILRGFEIPCDALAGHSSGENVALIAGGQWLFASRGELLKTIHKVTLNDWSLDERGLIEPGRYLAVTGLGAQVLQGLAAAYPGDVFLALDNCPHQSVLYVRKEKEAEASRAVAAAGGLCLALPAWRPYHTVLCSELVEWLRPLYKAFSFQTGRIPVYSSVTAAPIPGEPREIRELALSHWSHPVSFRRTVERLYDDGFRTFLEVGPNSQLTGFIGDTLRGRQHLALSFDNPREPGWTHVQRFAARLFVHGVPIRLGPVIDPSCESGGPDELRSAILKRHFEFMREFCGSQQRMLSAVTEAMEHGSSPGEFTAGADSLLGPAVERAWEHASWLRRFDRARDAFFDDHAMGRPRTTIASGVFPLPVVAFTTSMEIAAEAAISLTGLRSWPIAMREMRATRWLALDRGVLDVRISAKRLPSNGRPETCVRVEIFEEGANAGPAFDAIVELGGKRPQDAVLPRLQTGRPSRIDSREFYAERVFHGPRFHSVETFRNYDSAGCDAAMRVPPMENWWIPFGLLDGAGQLAAHWLMEQSTAGFGIFPFRAGRYTQFAAAPCPGSRVECRSRLTMRNDSIVSGRFDFLDESGGLWARLEDFELRRYESAWIPRFFGRPAAGTCFSEAWLQPETGLICRRIAGLSREFLEDGSGIWSRVLAHLVLTPRERDYWYGLPARGKRRYDWLLGRTVAKDAIRQWAGEYRGLQLSPADIEIVPDTLGKPIVKSQAIEARGSAPEISISHSGDRAVAAVADSGRRVGIDLENGAARAGCEWLASVFTDHEVELLGDNRSAADLLSLWCVKEAAAKALGFGLRGSPRHWPVMQYSRQSHGKSSARVDYQEQTLDVDVWRTAGEVFAVCQIGTKLP